PAWWSRSLFRPAAPDSPVGGTWRPRTIGPGGPVGGTWRPRPAAPASPVGGAWRLRSAAPDGPGCGAWRLPTGGPRGSGWRGPMARLAGPGGRVGGAWRLWTVALTAPVAVACQPGRPCLMLRLASPDGRRAAGARGPRGTCVRAGHVVAGVLIQGAGHGAVSLLELLSAGGQ